MFLQEPPRIGHKECSFNCHLLVKHNNWKCDSKKVRLGEIRLGQFHLNNRWMRPNVIIMPIANTKYKSHATFSEF